MLVLHEDNDDKQEMALGTGDKDTAIRYVYTLVLMENKIQN